MPSFQELLLNPARLVRLVMLDTECTGLSHTKDRIVELAMLRVELDIRRQTLCVIDTWHSYFDPRRRVDPIAAAVHGLTDEFLAGKPLFGDKVTEALAFVGQDPVVIHNAPFDVGMLDAELKRLRKGSFQEHVSTIIDTLAMSREVFPSEKVRLDDLCAKYEVDTSARTYHGALVDCQLLAEVSLRLFRDYGIKMAPRMSFLGFDPYSIDYTQDVEGLLRDYARLAEVEAWLGRFSGPLAEAIKARVRDAEGIPLDPAEVLESFAVPLPAGFELKVSPRTLTDYSGLLAEVAPTMPPETLEKFQHKSLALALRQARAAKYSPPGAAESNTDGLSTDGLSTDGLSADV